MKCFLFFLLFFIFTNAHTQINLDQFYNSNFEPTELNKSSLVRIKEFETTYRTTYAQDPISDRSLSAFALNHSFYFERLNKSGKVFFGDEISQYLNDLKDYLLVNDNRKNFIKVYLVDFPQLNAFTNDFGSIYINIGTIAKIKTEPQLLAVLAHEISHVLLRHSLKEKNYLDSISYTSLKKNYEEFETHYFNQKQELEADSLSFQLLINRNVDLTSVADLFDLLELNSSPIYSRAINFSSFFSKNEPIKDYLEYIEKLNSDTLFKNPNYSRVIIDVEKEVSTHPDVKVRKTKFNNLNWQKSTTISYYKTTKFEELNRLSSFVFLNTLITDGQYVDALYLVCNLLNENQDQATTSYLERKKIKLLLLLTQQKYRMLSEDIVINNHGIQCTDGLYYGFRRNILSITPIEFNLLTCLAIKDYLQLNNDPYFERMLSFSYQFLYRNNPDLFKNDGTKIIPLSLDDIVKKVGGLKNLIGYQTKDEAKRLVSLKDKNYVLVEFYISSFEFIESSFCDLLYSDSDLIKFNDAVKQYKQKRTQFESSVPLNQFPTTINPLVAKKRLKKSTFFSKKPISPTSKIALFESLSVFYVGSNKIIKRINLKKTLKIEELVQHSISENEFFSNNVSNLIIDSVRTVKDNYLHNNLMVHLEESLVLEDLFYSSVDEEIQIYIHQNQIDYFALNLNYVFRNTTSYKQKSCVYYTLFFDSNTGNVAYLATVFSKKIKKGKHLDYILNLSFRNHVY